MEVIFPNTDYHLTANLADAASNMDHSADVIMSHDRIINVRQHSLHTVVGYNKSLWKLPQQWTQAHLQALCVDRQNSAAVDDCDREDGLSLHALIPDLFPACHPYYHIESLARGRSCHSGRATDLRFLFVFQNAPPKPTHKDIDVGGSNNPALFSMCDDDDLKLTIGRRAYRLPLDWTFHLGPLVLPWLDSNRINSHWTCYKHVSNEFFEPCLTAVLIAMAQKKSSSMNGSSMDKPAVIKVQLLFTHRRNKQHMFVYTARVSRHLLERFQYPNRPPTTCSTSPLIQLQHKRVPYKPYKTFRRRLLARVSVTATSMDRDYYVGLKQTPSNQEPKPSGRKRKSSHACDTIDRKRQRQEGLRSPLRNLDPNNSHP